MPNQEYRQKRHRKSLKQNGRSTKWQRGQPHPVKRMMIEIEIVIVQPPHIRRWVTTWNRLSEFTAELQHAVKQAQKPDAPLAIGDWCRFCTAKPICPQMTGAIERTVDMIVKQLDGEEFYIAPRP